MEYLEDNLEEWLGQELEVGVLGPLLWCFMLHPAFALMLRAASCLCSA